MQKISLNEACQKIAPDHIDITKHYKTVPEFVKFKEDCKKAFGVDVTYDKEFYMITLFFVLDVFAFDQQMKIKYPELNIS